MKNDNISVVIVDDDAIVRENLQFILNAANGISCEHSFGDAESAIQEIPQIKPDVVLMDICLVKMNGIECTRLLKASNPEIQFVACTVSQDHDTVYESLCAGATGYLLKNSTGDEFVKAIREVLEGGSPMSPVIARKVVETFNRKKPAMKQSIALTKRETEILALLAQGYMYKELSVKLYISMDTVRSHIRNIYEKLQVNSKIDAINKAFGLF